MSIFTLQSVRKDFGTKEILRDASFSLDARDKVGLIGVNGSGKSTLLKILGGLEPIDGGQLLVSPNTRVVYLSQQPEMDKSHTVLEQVFADCGEQMKLVREHEDLSYQIARAQGKDLDRLMAQLSRITEQIESEGAWAVETSAKIVLSKLGIQDFDARIGGLSGGYRKRVALAAALLSEPDVLLMDEPTNHLDALSVEWLQDYLLQYRGALLLVTHDRYFLDRVTNRILEIDRGDLYSHEGNYAYYLEKKAQTESAAASGQRKHQGVLRRELEWLKRGPKARSTKQKARIERIHRMQEQVFKQAQGKVEIATAGRRIGKKVIALTHVSKRYSEQPLIQDFTYEFSPEDRVGIIGSNGVGKSTLLDLITERIQPDTGTVETGSTVHIGYFDQHSEDLVAAITDPQRAASIGFQALSDRFQEMRVINYIKEAGASVTTVDGSQISASQMLERFLFTGEQQYTPLNKLSGGEKRRLFLLRILMSAPNVLILDEPTNDLDVSTLSVLEEYLEDFNGCVIVVSHDRYFLDRTVDTIFAFEAPGVIRQYPGNYSVYLDYKRAEVAEAKTAQKVAPDAQATIAKPKIHRSAPESSRPRKLSYKEKREFEALELKIPEMETEKAEIEKTLYYSPPAGYTKLQELSERLAELNRAIDEATEHWLQLAEIETEDN